MQGKSVPVEAMRICPPENTIFERVVRPLNLGRPAVMLDAKAVNEPSARSAFTALLQLPERETRSSVMGTTLSHLRFFDSDLARKLTDTTTVDLDALINGEPRQRFYDTASRLRRTGRAAFLRRFARNLAGSQMIPASYFDFAATFPAFLAATVFFLAGLGAT